MGNLNGTMENLVNNGLCTSSLVCNAGDLADFDKKFYLPSTYIHAYVSELFGSIYAYIVGIVSHCHTRAVDVSPVNTACMACLTCWRSGLAAP